MTEPLQTRFFSARTQQAMAANRLGAGLVASAAIALILASHSDGHCHQQFPISRQYSWSLDFYDSK